MGEFIVKTTDDTGLKNLCGAIIEKAVEDYRYCLQFYFSNLYRYRERDGKLKEIPNLDVIRNRKVHSQGDWNSFLSSLKFFKRDWCDQLSAPVGGFHGSKIRATVKSQEIEKAIEEHKVYEHEYKLFMEDDEI